MAVLNKPTVGPKIAGASVRRAFRLATTLLLLLANVKAPAQTAVAGEYQIKAVFLFNFAQFVEWPPRAFSDPLAPLVIGVLGTDPFGAQLDEAVRGEKIGLRPLSVRRFRHVEEVVGCHILFISRSEAAGLEQIVARLKDQNILTVCEAEGSAQKGVMIHFLTEKHRIRLRINLDAAKAASLTISSKLLRPAEIVTGQKN